MADGTDGGTITITLREYAVLQANSLQLALLETLGVDNWQGYRTPPKRSDYATQGEYKEALDKAFSGD